MEKKAFFRDRAAEQIQGMNFKKVDIPKNLVRRIMDLDPKVDSLGLKFSLIPEEFMAGRNFLDASRVNLRRGFYLRLNQPMSIEQARKNRRIPLQIRQEALSELRKIPEEHIFHLGYAFRSIVGTYRPLILVPFWSILEGCRRDAYDQKVCKNLPFKDIGSKVEPYIDSKKEVERKGGKVLVRFPSTYKGDRPYKIRWENLAVIDNEDKRVIGWSTSPSYALSESEEVDELILTKRRFKEPLHKLYNFGYKNPDFDMRYPQEIGSHQTLIRHFMRNHNLVPLEMSQYAIPSRMGVDFYNKLRNNVIIFDKTLIRPRFRKLHLDEVCTSIARHVGNFDPDETMYWDSERDGRIRDYDF